MQITIIGIGYVGLSNSVLLAQNNKVIAVDIDPDKVKLINERKSPIEDQDIQEYMQNAVLDLQATTDMEEACAYADFIIIATPTNYDSEKDFFDTSTVDETIRMSYKINPQATIVIKSTIPLGYTKLAREKYNKSNIIFSPEFLREGKALYDNLYPSRIIAGVEKGNDDLASRARIFVTLLKDGAIKKEIPVLIMDSSEAEAVKLFANTYLAMRVGYINELDTYAELMGLNTKSIIEGMSLDPRIGSFYNNPSFGYGGYCLPKDTKQLLASYTDVDNNMIRAIVETNNTRKKHIVDQVLKKNPKVVGIYRLVMKSDSDNFRESAIQGIMEKLKIAGIDIAIYEPTIQEERFCEYPVIHDLKEFKDISDVIMANRYNEELADSLNKIYTRDLYYRD